MDYASIFKPETLTKLNRQSADNLRTIKQEFNLMDQGAYLRLLQDIMAIEAPYKAQLEQLAVNMVEDLYPVIEEQGIKIDAGLTDMNGTRDELAEIKVNVPISGKLNGKKVTSDSFALEDSNFYLGHKEGDYITIKYGGPIEYSKLLKVLKSKKIPHEVIEGPNGTGKFKVKPQYFNLNEGISPEGRRRIINSISQGAALKGAFSFYLFKDHLDAIDPTLVGKYNEVMKRTFGVYDDDNIIAMMMTLLAQGVDLKGQAGGSSKVIIKEIKVNNPGIKFPIIFNSWNEFKKIYPTLNKLGYTNWLNQPYGETDINQWARLPLSINLHYPEHKITTISSPPLNESQESGITIRARAICFPMLVHEIIKGLYELISLQGFKGDKEQNQAVVDKVDKLEHEPHDLQKGKFIFEALNNLFADSSYNDPRIREHFFIEIYQLDDEEFLEFIENTINGELTKEQIRWYNQILKEIAWDIKEDDFKETGIE